MNNNSYVYISSDKLVEVIVHCCPPNKSVDHCERLAYNGRFVVAEDCLKCWTDWLKDGE